MLLVTSEELKLAFRAKYNPSEAALIDRYPLAADARTILVEDSLGRLSQLLHSTTSRLEVQDLERLLRAIEDSSAAVVAALTD